jgi:hypothetical protein
VSDGKYIHGAKSWLDVLGVEINGPEDTAIINSTKIEGEMQYNLNKSLMLYMKC